MVLVNVGKTPLQFVWNHLKVKKSSLEVNIRLCVKNDSTQYFPEASISLKTITFTLQIRKSKHSNTRKLFSSSDFYQIFSLFFQNYLKLAILIRVIDIYLYTVYTTRTKIQFALSAVCDVGVHQSILDNYDVHYISA
jgi:hypothetical protein